MNVSQLEYYVSAVESGSYVSASKELFVNPSTISLAISSLENEFGIQLLIRSNNGISTTRNGQIFYERACAALSVFDQLSNMSSRAKGVRSGRITLAVADDPWRGSVADLCSLDSFRAANPSMTLSIVKFAGTICSKALDCGVADAALTIEAPASGNIESSRLCSRRVAVLAKREGKFSGFGDIRINDIAETPIALPSDIGFLYRKIIDLFRKKSSAPCFEYVPPSRKNIASFVLSSDGIVFVIDDHSHAISFPELQVLHLAREDDFQLPVFFSRRVEPEKDLQTKALKEHFLESITS